MAHFYFPSRFAHVYRNDSAGETLIVGAVVRSAG